LARQAAGAFLGLRRDPNARERFGVAGDVPVQTRDQRERISSVGFYLPAVLVPIARSYDEVLHTQRHESAV
jgi:hypothetical protein